MQVTVVSLRHESFRGLVSTSVLIFIFLKHSGLSCVLER